MDWNNLKMKNHPPVTTSITLPKYMEHGTHALVSSPTLAHWNRKDVITK